LPLTDVSIQNAKATDRPIKLFDRDGLHLLIHPNGSQWRRFKYRVGGRKKLISFGTYQYIAPLSMQALQLRASFSR
jgi:hypothetical protein